MGLLKFLRRKRKALPMHPGNILMIASSPRDIEDAMKALGKSGYVENSDFLRLDNGDFAIVFKKRGTQ